MPLWLAEKANLRKISYPSGIHKEPYRNTVKPKRGWLGPVLVLGFLDLRLVAMENADTRADRYTMLNGDDS